MSVTLENGRIMITTTTAMTPFKRLKPGTLKEELGKVIPGIQWDGAKKLWWITTNEENVAKVNRLFKVSLKSNAPAIRSHISMFPFKTKPRRVQLEALEASGLREAFAYFMEPGLGKSATTIYEMEILNRDREVEDVIVVCPKSITGTWLREMGVHGHYEQWDIFRWNSDLSPSRVEHVHSPESGGSTMRWFIINIDAIQPDTAGWRAAYSFIMRSTKAAIVVDESTTIKNIEAKRTLQAMILSENCRYRRILTGTPIANTPLDLYAQLTFLDVNIFYGWSFAAFRNHYAITGGYKQREIYGYTNQDELAQIVGQHSFRATKSEYLADLPPRIYQIREIALSKKTWAAYDMIVNDVLAELSGEKTITVDMVTKKIIKLRQLVGGWVLEDKDPENKAPRVAHQMATEKLEDFKVFMEECRAIKVLVWCQFVHEVLNLHTVVTEMGFKAVKYYGQMKSKERDHAEREFELGGAQVMILQNDTGSMGLTLNAASVSYMYSNPAYLLNRNQLEDRNYRDGQTKSVTFVDAICVGTVDQTNYEGLMSKKEISQMIMEASAHKDMEALRGILYPKRSSGSWKADKRAIT